jgi:RNA polymerase sigma-B factor
MLLSEVFMLIHIVSRPLSELSHVPRSGVRSLVRTVREAGAEVVEDVGLTGDFSQAVAACTEQLKRQWAQTPPQIVHSIGLVATMAALAARPDGLPVVSTFDESPVPTDVEARLAKQVDAVIPLSTPEQDVWRQLGARTASPGVIALAPPAVNAPATSGEDVVCLCSGDELSRVIESMPYWGPARLIVLGRVSDQRWTELMQQARALGVEQRLVRRPGLRGEQRQAMWRDAALLLAGTEGARHGGFVLEAAAHGVPSVAVAVEAHLDHIVPGATGLLVEPGTGPRTLGAIVSELLTDDLRRRGMGASSLVRVRALNEQPAVGQRLLGIYRQYAGLVQEQTKVVPRLTPEGSALALKYMPLARQLAHRYAGRGQRLDDLIQVASLGLVRAASRFNPELGNEFHSFAVPTILGELRRHFRDHAWAARVPRSLQEATLKVQRASDELRVARGQDPTPAEVADELGLVEEEVLQAMQARGEAMSSKSLDHPMGEDGAEAFGDLVGDTDPDLEYVELREAVRSALHKLPEREREILLMRFYGEHTQSEIAERMGLSQVHVSRLITRTLTALRDHVMNDVPLPKSWGQQAERAGDPERRRTAA